MPIVFACAAGCETVPFSESGWRGFGGGCFEQPTPTATSRTDTSPSAFMASSFLPLAKLLVEELPVQDVPFGASLDRRARIGREALTDDAIGLHLIRELGGQDALDRPQHRGLVVLETDVGAPLRGSEDDVG